LSHRKPTVVVGLVLLVRHQLRCPLSDALDQFVADINAQRHISIPVVQRDDRFASLSVARTDRHPPWSKA
jgi:hypothetical protein